MIKRILVHSFLTNFMIVFLGCSSLSDFHDTIPLYYTFSKEVDRAKKIYEDHCKVSADIPIRLSYLPENIIGVCFGWRMHKFFRHIEIDIEYFKTASRTEIEMTILHELGHCVSDLDHDQSEEFLFVPKSLMYPSHFSTYFYNRDKEHYIKSVCPSL